VLFRSVHAACHQGRAQGQPARRMGLLCFLHSYSLSVRASSRFRTLIRLRHRGPHASRRSHISFPSFQRCSVLPRSFGTSAGGLASCSPRRLGMPSDCFVRQTRAPGHEHSVEDDIEPTAATPNYALQRTAPVCHAACLRSHRASPPQSLSLGSLGVSSRLL